MEISLRRKMSKMRSQMEALMNRRSRNLILIVLLAALILLFAFCGRTIIGGSF